jgi:hypothetical protein
MWALAFCASVLVSTACPVFDTVIYSADRQRRRPDFLQPFPLALKLVSCSAIRAKTNG